MMTFRHIPSTKRLSTFPKLPAVEMKKNIPILLCLLISSACRQPGAIMTVTGPIRPSDMGVTLPHEHILVDWIGADSTGYHRWNRGQVAETVLPYLLQAKELGVRTFLDCTPAYLGRDPILLKTLSERSGIHIVTNTGLYGAVDNRFIPAYAATETAETLSERWIREFRDGIENTGIRPGFIKIAVAGIAPLSDLHGKIVRAACLAHLATGLTINSHTGPAAAAFEQLAVLDKEGVSPRAFVWTHAYGQNSDSLEKAARRGAWISLDIVGDSPEQINAYAEILILFKEKGLLRNILLSHDAGVYDPAKKNGGTFRGFNAIFERLIPALRKRGFSQKQIDILLVENPRKAYTIRVRKR